MNAHPTPLGAVLLTEAEAAAFLRLQPVTLKKWRCRGRGPAYVRLGAAIRYELSALLAYLDCTRITPGATR